MPRRKLPLFTGELSKPIDTGITVPLNPKYRPDEYIAKRGDKLFKMRMAKMPELARQLGIKIDHLDLSDFRDLTRFYGHIALNLAVKFGIPGFQEVKPKWSPDLVAGVLDMCEQAKPKWSDFHVCLSVVKALRPDLRENANHIAANDAAKQLRDKVSALRTKRNREQITS